MNNKGITQYLDQYAEPDIRALASLPVDFNWQSAVVLPLYRETPDAVIPLLQLPSSIAKAQGNHPHTSVLWIAVVNQPDSDDHAEPQQQLVETLQSQSQLLWQQGHLSLLSLGQSGSACLLVQRFADDLRLPEKQGVGLARKIGADIAVQLWGKQQLQDPWIRSTDADVQLPDDYFSTSPTAPNAVAGVYQFQHQRLSRIPASAEIVAATQYYETRLHYYVAGLKYAGSAYAYHTIGSCLLFHCVSYCQVRGFPKRAAGEDFYLLNKLAKLGSIETLPCCIGIGARASDRTPFGTGTAATQISELAQPALDYLTYDPAIFTELKHLLTAIEHGVINRDLTALHSGLSTTTVDALASLGYQNAFAKLLQNAKTEAQLRQQVAGWFDAFRTLKFVHFLEANGYPAVPLQQALERAPFWSDNKVSLL